MDDMRLKDQHGSGSFLVSKSKAFLMPVKDNSNKKVPLDAVCSCTRIYENFFLRG
jgi:hypothetical protein